MIKARGYIDPERCPHDAPIRVEWDYEDGLVIRCSRCWHKFGVDEFNEQLVVVKKGEAALLEELQRLVAIKQELARAYAEYAEAVGKEIRALTDAEKQEALLICLRNGGIL